MPLQKPHRVIHSQAARANLGSCTLLRSLINRTPQTPHFTTRDEFPTWQLIYPHQLALIATRPSPPSMPPVLRKRNVPQAQARKAPATPASPPASHRIAENESAIMFDRHRPHSLTHPRRMESRKMVCDLSWHERMR
jgi:hypothetical protein